MDEKHKELLLHHRSKFVLLVDVEHLIPFLEDKGVLCAEDTLEVRRQVTTTARAEKLLDILPSKGSHAFQSLCIALESSYPHILTIMFLGLGHGSSNTGHKVSESNLASMGFDSELDGSVRCDPEKDNFKVEPIPLHSENYASQRSSRVFMTPSPQSMFSHDYDVQPDVALLKAELKLFAHEREAAAAIRKEMHKVVDSQSRRLNTNTSDSKMSSLGTLTKHGSGATFEKDVSSVGGSDKVLSSSRDYDRLKTQCESAMRELQSLRRQHSETMRKCEMAMKESEFYRVQHKTALAKLDQQQSDALTLKSQYNEILADKRRLEQEVLNLQKFREEDRKEVVEMRRQQQEAMNENGNSEAINQMYITAMRKYEAIKDDYDSLRKRYADLVASHSAAASKLELSQEEVARVKKQLEDVVQERNGAIRERNGLKQQCTAAIRQWDSALRERNEAKECLSKVQQQRDEAMKEINQAMAVRIKATKDLARLNEERNAAVQEYTLIMSERDSVHKEIEKLQEELSECNEKMKTLEGQKKASYEEVETLRREIASALLDRDKTLKQCHDLREKYGDYETSRMDGFKEHDDHSLNDFDYYKRDREIAHKTHNSLVDHSKINEGHGKIQKEKVDNLDQANQEIDRLRKSLEKLLSELNEALQEAEVSKRRRDWAFNERDKIVQERESVRTLCDKLRRERDRAVSDLAEALRDSDDIKKQRNEASKELKDLREKIEAQLEKESRLKHMNSIGHNHSRDSAIDADLQEWETETLEFEIGASNDDDVGFELAGGRDDLQVPESAVYVINVVKGSAADGKLRVNDCVIRINNIDVTSVERRIALEALKNCGSVINMVIRRRRLTSSRYIQSVHLHITGGKAHGLHLETGVYVSRIDSGSAAAKEGNLALGDRVINVNGRFLEGMWSGIEAMKLLDSAGDCIVLSLLKCANIPSASVSSSSSGHNLQENGEVEKSASPKPFITSNSPMKEHNHVTNKIEIMKKVTTSSSQTEESSLFSSPERSGGKKRDGEKANGHGSPQQTLLDKLFGERRSSKERNKEKLSWASTSPPLQEEAVIAELDSVIEHFKKNASGKSGKSRKKREKDQEKNGGTWPKYRGQILDFPEAGPGTMTHSRRKKERVSITSLLNATKLPPAFYEVVKQQDHERSHDRETLPKDLLEHDPVDVMGRSSRRSSVSSGVVSSERERSGFAVYKSESGHGLSSLPPQTSISTMNPVSVAQLKSSGHFLSSPKSSFHPPSNSILMPDGKNSTPIHYANSSFEFPLDYSVVSANRDKEILEYYKNKNKARPKSAMILPSDSDRFLSLDGSLIPKPSSLDIQSLYKPIGQFTRSQLSPTDPLNLSPRLSERSASLHQRAPSQPVYVSSVLGHQPSASLCHAANNNSAYYTVSSGRLSHNHSVHCHPHGTTASASSSSSTGVGSPSPRYSSPPTIPYMSRSGESLLGGSIPEASPLPESRFYTHRYTVNPSPSPSPSHYNNYSHSPSHSMELPHFHPVSASKRTIPTHAHPMPSYRAGDFVGFASYDGPSTIPKRSHYRIRIPSNQSVTSKSSTGKVSTSSIERASASDRSSPMLAFLVETVTPGGPVQRSACDFHNKKPAPGELRNIRINKNTEETLGIQIDCGPRGGIFVSSVSENSLAAQAGIHVGDQLLEVCGINMRSATYLLAANVLRQCGDSVTMLVQYNPEKYRDSLGTSDSSGSSSGGGAGEDSPLNTPTPRSSPKNGRSSPKLIDVSDSLPASATSTLKRKNTLVGTNSKEEPVTGDIYEPRFVFLKTMTSNLGITFLGGNAVGIFVHKVQQDSPASGPNGLQCGDQILEYNGVDLRQATAEQAAYELAKRAETITILAQYNIDRYTEIQHLPGDSLFIRAMFDHQSENPNELSFHKDDILYVDNTMFNGVSGLWRAWRVDEDGHKKQCGVIPSKYKVEEDLLMRRSLGELDSESGSRRSALSARRSFFRRYRKHQRSNSRDSKELASFSDVSINSFSDSGTLIEDPPILTYQRVERLDSDLVLRPVLIIGPLIDVVVDKLVQDFPHKFARCIPEVMNASAQAMEKGLHENIYIDYRHRGSHYECLTLASIKEICDKPCHCIVDISPAATERLHRVQIYPIVLFIKFKSTKQIREVKDPRLVSEKVSTKAAKEMYDHSLRLESEYRHLISAVIPGGSLAYMCTQIKAQVDQEQSKTLWVPTGSI